MPASTFSSSEVTVPAGAATRLSTLLVAEGYAGTMIGAFLEISAQAVADLFHGASSATSATTGRALAANAIYRREATPRGIVDPGRIWLFSATGGNIGVTFESY